MDREKTLVVHGGAQERGTDRIDVFQYVGQARTTTTYNGKYSSAISTQRAA